MKLTEEVIEKALYVDYRKKENKEMLQKVLHEIPQYKKCVGDVPQELFEKMINIITGKYAITIQWISHVKGNDIVYWSSSIREDVLYEYRGTITAATMYELLAKIALCLFAMTKGYKGGLTTREKLALEKEREKQKHD